MQNFGGITNAFEMENPYINSLSDSCVHIIKTSNCLLHTDNIELVILINQLTFSCWDILLGLDVFMYYAIAYLDSLQFLVTA